MSEWDDVMGSSPPQGVPKGSGSEGTYNHWCTPGKLPGEHSADKRAFAENRAGMKGTENPFVPYEDRERGDQSAKGRANQLPGAGHDHSWFTDQFAGDNSDV